MTVATHEYAALAWKMKKNLWLRGKQSLSLSTIKEESTNSCLYSYYLLLYDQAPVYLFRLRFFDNHSSVSFAKLIDSLARQLSQFLRYSQNNAEVVWILKALKWRVVK